MRRAALSAFVLFTATNLFAASPGCTSPNLVISGIQGEMQAPCAGAIEFTSASFTAPSTTSSQSNASGAGAGRSTPGTLRVTKALDKASSALMLACANGTHMQNATLSYPNGANAVTVTFENVTIASLNESINPTNESVEFRYAKIMVQSGGTKVDGSVIGHARPSSASVAVIGSDGKSQPVSHLSLTVRPGGTTFDSVQLAPPPPGIATTRVGTLKSSGRAAGPEESIHLNYGKVEIKYQNQSASFQFNGGTLVNGNLRASKVSYTGPTMTALHPQ
jgi:type VI protein secretion system component Hcp